jgi:hypothetical protein
MRISAFIAVLSAIAIVGCSSSEKAPAPPSADELHIKNIAIIYQVATGANKGKAAKSIDELKKVVSNMDSERAQEMKIDPKNMDSIFNSPRDGQPYVIRFKGDGVLAYEKTGKNGKRLVVYTTMEVKEIEEAKLKEVVPDA